MAKKIKGVTCITRNGSTYWYARVDGERVYCGKGDKGYKLAVAARSKYVAKRYENREMAAGLKVRRAEFKTVQDLSNWYMELPTVQQQAGYQRKVIACSHLLKFFGRMALVQVEADDLERYREARKSKGAADGTVNVELAALSAMYHLARKRKKIPSEFMPGEFVMVNDRNPRRIILENEFETLVEHAGDDFADVLICGHESGMRSGEICNLRARQVHLDLPHISGQLVDYIDLGIFDTKTGTRRTVPVSARLKGVLERRLQGLAPEDHVFTYTGRTGLVKTFYPAMISEKMRYSCSRAKIVYGDNPVNEKGERIGIVFHCLRHTRTTRWVEMGFSDEIIRRATGHRSLEAYQQYVKLDPAAVMRLVENRHTNDIKSLQGLAGS
jgi:integrase